MHYMMNFDLNQQLTIETILELAGDRFFARGESYAVDGAVEDLVESRGVIKATVIGTYDYRVKIWNHETVLDYVCNCPVGQEGLFCKHLVATGLTWIEEQQDASPGKGNSPKTKTQKTDIFANLGLHLSTLNKKQLIDIIIEQAEDDAAFRNALSVSALANLPVSEADLNAHKDFIRKTIQLRGYVDYRGMYRYLQKVEPVIDLISQLYAQKHFEQVMALSDYALKLGFTAYNNVDDSDGGFGGVLNALADYHWQASNQCKPDKKRLGKSLYDLQMRDNWDLIDFRQYEAALGKEGLNQFKSLAQRRWQKTPHNNDYNITQVMQQLAEMDNDIDAVIAIKKQGLSSAYCYCEIAEILKKAKRHDEALQWAEKGLKVFRHEPHSTLVDFLIPEYQRREQHDKAIQLAWQQFIKQPHLQDYQQLKTCADKASAWEAWRTKAIQWLRKDYLPKLNSDKPNRWLWAPHGHSLLVEIFLWEKDLDKALQEAKQNGCIEHLWFALAKACEKTHPADALKIYQDHIRRIIELTNNDAYDRACDILKIIKALMKKLKQQLQFKDYIELLRTDYKQKRNFIKRVGKI